MSMDIHDNNNNGNWFIIQMVLLIIKEVQKEQSETLFRELYPDWHRAIN